MKIVCNNDVLRVFATVATRLASLNLDDDDERDHYQLVIT